MKKFLLAIMISVFCVVNSMARSIYVNILLDETGSMSANRESTVSAFNDFLVKQKDKKADIYISLWMFNNATGVRTIYDAVNVKNIEKLDLSQYNPNDTTTPLYDAIGKAITYTDITLSKHTPYCSVCLQPIKPSVLFVVMTDGLENASHEFTLSSIQSLLKEKKNQGWETLYIGDDIEQQKEAVNLGFYNAQVINSSNCNYRMKSVNCSVDALIPVTLPTLSGTTK